MKTLRVRDIMTTDVHTLPANASVIDAVQTLGDCGISGAPVLDRGRIVGVVSRSDLAGADGVEEVDHKPRVDTVMSRVVYAVRPGDPVMSAVRLMVAEKIHRAVVITEEGALVGMLTPMDVLRALAEGDHVQEGDYALEARREFHHDPEMAVGYGEQWGSEMTT
ncbi:CBS domain-containing protein [Chondromyces apiculatus]|uniref:PolyA polymerase family protein n=1 Tax=Chondromyces apiculatus DSM 436 TaxID=1192034 RepID=A0A017TGC0_9BACT|nr:CBS domain-containing protein [Chondromyces apiculatus]EYF07870.1 polyA polymerase family protein [Chondromyces apiculatus DSM 436]